MSKEVTLYEVMVNPLGGKAYLIEYDEDLVKVNGPVSPEDIPDFYDKAAMSGVRAESSRL